MCNQQLLNKSVTTSYIDVDLYNSTTLNNVGSNRLLPCSDRINAYYQNVRGLRTKTSNFLLSSTSCYHDVIALTETSLNSSLFDGELFDTSQFLVYRCDRSMLNSVSDVGGGVLIAVRSHIKSELVTIPDVNEVEMVIVKLHLDQMNIFISCIYIPSGSPIATYQLYNDTFAKVLNYLDLDSNDELWVFGDFNLPNVEWIAQSDCSYPNDGMENLLNDGNVLIPCNLGDSVKAELLHLLLSADLHQVNNVPNCDDRILDLIFTSNPCNVEVVESPCPMTKIDAYHPPVEVSIPVSKSSRMKPCNRNTEFNYAKADFDGLNAYLSSTNWNPILNCSSGVDDKVNAFYDVLLTGLRSFVPYKRNVPMKHPPWYSKRIRSLKNQRNKAHKEYKGTGSMASKLKFYAIRNEFETAQENAFQDYLVKTQNDLIADPDKFWQYVKSKKNSSDYPSVMSTGQSCSSDPEIICNYFADFFESVYRADETNDNENAERSNVTVDSASLSIGWNTVLRSLESIDTSMGNGPDDISPLLLKQCASGLAVPLHSIYNHSLSSNVFPARWKTSYVKPIHKSGSRNVVENYRGVAILPTFGKLFESIVCKLITDHWSSSVSQAQHGFVKGRSTSTNLLEFTNYAIGIIESGSQLDVIYTDFQKAFDRVSHAVLLGKLSEIGMDRNLICWIKSYLCKRFQYVKLMGHNSKKFEVKSGVPQGSHLGPLLFILFMDDVTRIFKTMKILYADDLKLCSKIKSVSDAIQLQLDINALSDWCKRNHLDLNVGKCKTMSYFRKRTPIKFDYTIDGIQLTRVKIIQDLGVWFDEQLTFNRHIDYVTSKAYSMLGFVKRICKQFTNIHALKSVYFAHVRSYLEYASVVWHPHQFIHISRIESIQKKFLMYALRRTVHRDHNYRLPNYLERCASIEIEPLWRRRINLNVMYVFDLLRGRINSPNLASKIRFNNPVREFRVNEFLVVDFHRTDYGQHEPMNSIIRMFNAFSQLYDESLTRNVFRSRVRLMKLSNSFLIQFGLSSIAQSLSS